MYDEAAAAAVLAAAAGPAEANNSAALPADEAADSRRSIGAIVGAGAAFTAVTAAG